MEVMPPVCPDRQVRDTAGIHDPYYRVTFATQRQRCRCVDQGKSMQTTLRSTFGLLALAALTVSTSATAFVVELIKDTDTSPAPAGSMPRHFYRYGNELYFTASRPDTGMELFATGATPGTTRLVADFAPYGASSYARVLGELHGSLLVAAAPDNTVSDWYARATQILLVSPDGSSRQVLTAQPPWGNAYELQRFEPLRQTADRVWFRDGSDGSLWASDGTVSGTQRVFASISTQERTACTTNGRLVFTNLVDGGRRVYASDGTPAGTGVIADFTASAEPYSLVAHAGQCWFLQFTAAPSSARLLWRTDGTVVGTVNVATIPETTRLASVSGTLIAISNPANTLQLRRAGETEPYWQGDGLMLGSRESVSSGRILMDVYNAQSATFRMLVTGATAVTTQWVQRAGQPLDVRYDGRWTAGSDFVVVNDSPGISYRVDAATGTAIDMTVPDDLFYAGAGDMDGVLVGNASDAEFGEEIWRSDGSSAGTYRLADVAQVNTGGMDFLVAHDIGRDNVLFYAAYGSGAASDLWRSNGSAAGTYALPRSEYDDFEVVAVRALGSGVLFATGNRLSSVTSRYYVSSGDFGKTALAWNQGGSPDLIASDRAGFFPCRNAQQWTVCGIPAGGAQALPLLTGSDFPPRVVGSLGDHALLWSEGTLWRSDGTPTGTLPIASGVSSPGSLSSSQSVRVGNRLYFEACTSPSQYSCGLHVSDGTPAGTQAIKEIYWPIKQMAAIGNIVYFVTENSPSHHLWRSDGTAAGTQPVTPLGRRLFAMVAAGSHLHLLRDDLPLIPGYVVSDGTAAGTVAVNPPQGLTPTSGPLVARTSDEVLIGCIHPSTGAELCRANADGSGFALALDMYPGPQSSGASWLGGRGEVGYLIADDGRRGYEPWRTIGDRVFADDFQ
jgi:ELWxxDGT repeat protein